MRHRRERRLGKAVALSADGGETFGPPAMQPALRGPVCQSSLASVPPSAAAPTGSLLFSGPDSSDARASLVVRRSRDGGGAWDVPALSIDPGAAAYSALAAPLPLARGCDGGAPCGGVLYEAAGTVIRFTRFPLAF